MASPASPSRPARLYDVTRPDFPARCHEVYRTLRDEHPLYEDPGGAFFAVSRYEDVRRVVNDDEHFSNEGVSTTVRSLPILQQIDPPLHDELRSLVTVALTPRRVAALEPRIRELARGLLANCLEQSRDTGRCDFVAGFARHFPSMVIAEMVGLPPERREPVLEWTESLLGISKNGDANVETAAMAIADAFGDLLEARRKAPRDDLMSALLAAEIDGGRKLSEPELLGFCFQLVLAGNDTTTNLIANGSVLLARHPEQRAAIVAEPALLENAIEEMLRFESPTQVLPRRVRVPVELHGRKLAAGTDLRLIWAAANRDPRFFPDADVFDIRRPNARRHLAFGQGRHFCVGAALARLEGRVAFEELLAAAPAYTLVEEPAWMHSVWARGYESVILAL